MNSSFTEGQPRRAVHAGCQANPFRLLGLQAFVVGHRTSPDMHPHRHETIQAAYIRYGIRASRPYLIAILQAEVRVVFAVVEANLMNSVKRNLCKLLWYHVER